MQTFDAKVIEHYAEAMAAGTQYQGMTVLEYADMIRKLIASTKTQTILDYGCGAAVPYLDQRIHEGWGLTQAPMLYDPANPKFAKKPSGLYDGVICSDVMEHIPLPLVDLVLADLFGYAKKFVFVAISCRSAKKWLPDGRNVHLTVRAPFWWSQRIAEVKSEFTKPLEVHAVYS